MCGGGGMHAGRHKQQSAGRELPSPPPPRRHAATWRGSGAWRAARHAPPLPAGTVAAHARCSRRAWARCRPRRARSQSRAASTRRHTPRRPSPRSVLLSPRRVARRPCSSCRQATSRWRRIARLGRSVPGRLPPPPRPHPRRPPRVAAAPPKSRPQVGTRQPAWAHRRRRHLRRRAGRLAWRGRVRPSRAARWPACTRVRPSSRRRHAAHTAAFPSSSKVAPPCFGAQRSPEPHAAPPWSPEAGRE